MAITIYNLKIWIKMLLGKSDEHVIQNSGKHFVKNQLSGYYNDLTEKVEKIKHFDKEGLPLLEMPNGDYVYWPVNIFQYGLGAYDKYLENQDPNMKEAMMRCATWAYDNQNADGSWLLPENSLETIRFSSMNQGEGASLLVRAYKESNEVRYLNAAKNALNFMVKSIEDGGPSLYEQDNIIFLEFPNKPPVLNGWIFSLWGLYDYLLVEKDPYFNSIYERSLNTIKKYLSRFDNGYWSLYDTAGMIASPHYHRIHIALMQALYQITDDETFKKYFDIWTKDQDSFFRRCKSFIVKVVQKIRE